jgi:hypothetical protein
MRWEGRPEGDVGDFFYNMATPVVASGVVQFALTAMVDDETYGAADTIGTGPIVLASYSTGSGTYLSAHRFGHMQGTTVTSQFAIGGSYLLNGLQSAGDIDSTSAGGYAARWDGSTLTPIPSHPNEIVASNGDRAFVAGTTGPTPATYGPSTIPGSSGYFAAIDASWTPAWAHQFAVSTGYTPVGAANASVLILAIELHEPSDLGGGVRNGRLALAQYSL